MDTAKDIGEWKRLCRVEDVHEGAPLCVDVAGLVPLAVYELNGAYYVTDNRCTHSNALLTDGYQEGTIIECALHGGRYDIRTGEATALPCHIPLRTYKVRLEDGWITVDALHAATGTEVVKPARGLSGEADA